MSAGSQRDLARRVTALIVGSLGLHVAFVVLSLWVVPSWRWSHEPIHAAVELAGSLIALLMAPCILELERRGRGTSFNGVVAAALVAMGVFDGAHALVAPGQQFVWLHTLATLFGGLLFALVWLPRRVGARVAGVTLVGSVGVSALSAVPGSVPTMVGAGGFTPLAQGLNVLGGAAFAAAAARMLWIQRRSKNPDDLLFVVHCGLFAAASIMFEQSELWDLAWWGWHVLRLAAYGAAMWFMLRTLRGLLEELEETNGGLELRVAARTRELEERSAQLEASNVELDAFAYAASHDLKEPLRGIGHQLVFLQEDCGHLLDEQGSQRIARLTKLCERLQVMVDELLCCARLGRTRTRLEEVDLDDVVDRALDAHALTVAGKNAEIRRPDPLPRVRCDRARVQEVFGSLLSNALKFNEAERPWVEFGARDGELFVRDNGVGIAPEHHDSVFGMFKRLHPRDTHPGTGTGLFLVRKIVSVHGGTVRLESEPGVGTTVWFTLGARREQARRAA